MTPNHVPTRPPIRNRRRAQFNWRPLAFLLSVALVALIATIVFVACSGSAPTPTGPTPAPTGPTVTANPEGTIAAGVSVNGVDVGGLHRGDAEIKLQTELPDVSSGKLTINIGSLAQDVTYASVSRAYDIDAILAAALTSGPGAVQPTVTFDADELARQINEFVATAQSQPINATISYENGEYVLTPAVDGRSVDATGVLTDASALMANGKPEDQVLDVQATDIPADIGSDAAQAAIARAQAVTAQPLTITVGTTSFSVPTTTLRLWVALEQASPGQWTLTVDETAVATYVGTIKSQVDQPPVEASWHFDNSGDAVVEPGQTGYVVDSASSTQAVVAVLSGAQAGQPVGPVALTAVATEPDFTTAEAQAAAGSIRLLGEWTTHYIPNHFNSDGINIRRPAELINGTVVQPGHLFDFVGLTGPFTVANGYGEGAALIHGHIKADGVLGGGLCSASTTMFNAALRAGFQMGARYNHAYYISRYPIGLDATIWVSGNSVKDMTFTNDSKYPIVIRSINKKRSVTFQVWGVPDGRTVTLSDPVVTNPVVSAAFYEFTNTLAPRVTAPTDDYLVDGFDAVVVRTVRDAAGQIIHQDTYSSHYTKVDVVVLIGRYPDDPPAGTRIPYDDLPPPPGPTPSPTPGPVTDPPTAGFTWSVAGGNPLKIKFTNTSTGGTSYLWDFGDGHTSTSANPVSHPYANANDYVVTLTVTNSLGSDEYHDTVHVPGGTPPTPAPTDTPSPTPTPT